MSNNDSFRNAWNALRSAWDNLNNPLPLKDDDQQKPDIESTVQKFADCARYVREICDFANLRDKNDPKNRKTITEILNGQNNSDNLGIQALWEMLAEDFEPQYLKQKGWDVIAENLNAACARLAETFNVQRA